MNSKEDVNLVRGISHRVGSKFISITSGHLSIAANRGSVPLSRR